MTYKIGPFEIAKIKVWNIVLFVTIFTLAPIAIQYAVNATSPMTRWVEYVSVEPLKTQYRGGDYVDFVSIRNVYRTSSIAWNDVLNCDYGNGFEFTQSYNSDSTAVLPPLENPETVIWRYCAPLPNSNATCYLQSNITLRLESGVTKLQVVRSHVFNVTKI